QILRWLFEAQFRKLTRHDWIAFAQRTWRARGGALVPDFDLELARSLRTVNLERLPTLWNEFDALAGVPLMVIRGGNSDADHAEKRDFNIRAASSSFTLSFPILLISRLA